MEGKCNNPLIASTAVWQRHSEYPYSIIVTIFNDESSNALQFILKWEAHGSPNSRTDWIMKVELSTLDLDVLSEDIFKRITVSLKNFEDKLHATPSVMDVERILTNAGAERSDSEDFYC